MPKIDPVGIVQTICATVQAPDLVADWQGWFRAEGLSDAVDKRDSPKLFDWLMGQFALQGVSDAVALGFIAKHGNVTYQEIAEALKASTCKCPKLVRFDDYHGCGYRKAAHTCGEPRHVKNCPVPAHDLRKGILNQLAYSLFLFIRDVCRGDLVGFIDQTLEVADLPGHPDRVARMGQALLGQLKGIRGVSDKLLAMTFADLLIGTGAGRPRWVEIGASLVAVDTLVHNLLHRTGILQSLAKTHAYGPACYRPNGCAAVIDHLARQIDARRLDQVPVYFPRYIQYSLWAFSAQPVLGICNGNRIDDSRRCQQHGCPVFNDCGRVTLRPVPPAKSKLVSHARARSPPHRQAR
jgi:hypothetical protein